MSNISLDDLIELSLLTEKTEKKCRELEDLQEKLSELKTRVNNSIFFTRLHPNVEWKILKMLKFKDYRNLALTCRRWFQAASSAPDHVKPSLELCRTDVKSRSLVICSKEEDDEDYQHVCFRIVPSLCLIDKIDMRVLVIEVNANMKFVRFIYENRKKINFKYLSISPPVFCTEKASMFYALAEKTNKLTLDRKIVKKRPHNNDQSCVFDLHCLFGRTFPHLQEFVGFKFESNPANFVLKQWTKGEFPNLQTFWFSLSEANDPEAEANDLETLLDSVTDGFQQFVSNKRPNNLWREHSLNAKFIFPGLEILHITVYKNAVSINRNGFKEF